MSPFSKSKIIVLKSDYLPTLQEMINKAVIENEKTGYVVTLVSCSCANDNASGNFFMVTILFAK